MCTLTNATLSTCCQNTTPVVCAVCPAHTANMTHMGDTRQLTHAERQYPVLHPHQVSYDGKYLTTAEGRVVRMFHTDSLQQFKMHKLTGANNAESASFCAARNVFAAGGEDMWVRLFNADTGAELECNKGHHGPVHAVRFAPTYESYASGSEDGTIRIYSLDNGSNGPATIAQ